jgi:peptide deformylase
MIILKNSNFILYLIVVFLLSSPINAHQKGEKMTTPPLPSYVVLDKSKGINPKILRTPSERVAFPLSKENQEILRILEAKFDAEENCAGLAAPQIGFSKAMIVFAAPEDPELKKWRPDLEQTMPKTIWINPSYEPIGEEVSTDGEACFSVADIAGHVQRYTKIRYHAFLPDGRPVTGEATGFLARIIQHETDHINGVLFVDRTDDLWSLEEYRRMRAEAMKNTEENKE